jgi:hypothetical protein
MNTRLAQFLSVIFHPVLMPTYALLLIFRQSTYFAHTVPNEIKIKLFEIILLNTLFLPVIISYIMVRRGWIKSLEMQQREERLFPYIVNLVLMLFAGYWIYTMRLPRVFLILTLGASAAVLCAVIINTKWKISIHMIGLGALLGTLFGISSFLLIDVRMIIILFLLIAGLVGVARITLGAHRPSQIYVGFLIGFFCEYLLLRL